MATGGPAVAVNEVSGSNADPSASLLRILESLEEE